MGCNCSGTAPAEAYIYTAPDGTVTAYTSEVQAQAAKIRNGGGSYTTR